MTNALEQPDWSTAGAASAPPSDILTDVGVQSGTTVQSTTLTVPTGATVNTIVIINRVGFTNESTEISIVGASSGNEYWTGRPFANGNAYAPGTVVIQPYPAINEGNQVVIQALTLGGPSSWLFPCTILGLPTVLPPWSFTRDVPYTKQVHVSTYSSSVSILAEPTNGNRIVLLGFTMTMYALMAAGNVQPWGLICNDGPEFLKFASNPTASLSNIVDDYSVDFGPDGILTGSITFNPVSPDDGTTLDNYINVWYSYV